VRPVAPGVRALLWQRELHAFPFRLRALPGYLITADDDPVAANRAPCRAGLQLMRLLFQGLEPQLSAHARQT
jgi:hypothetical protein